MTAPKRRIRLTLAYDGYAFEGWQSQAHGRTVQDTLEKALGEMTQEKLRVMGCSRTDSGVHALQYVAHFDTTGRIPPEGFLAGLNDLLPHTIAVLTVDAVGAEFHARDQAKRKTYRYEILNQRIRDPLRVHRVWQIFEPLDIQAMSRAAKHLEGEHDFSCFRAADDMRVNPVRTIEACRVYGDIQPNIQIDVIARGFMKYMVRNIVGTLVDVGRGNRKPESLPALLATGDRAQAGETAPPDGLYLVRVEY